MKEGKGLGEAHMRGGVGGSGCGHPCPGVKEASGKGRLGVRAVAHTPVDTLNASSP